MKKFYIADLTDERRHSINRVYEFITTIIRVVNPNLDLTGTQYENIYNLVGYFIDDIINDKEK